MQTRLPRHEVIDAALHADPAAWPRAERARREALRLPAGRRPGGGVGGRRRRRSSRRSAPEGVEVLGPADGRWLVRAADHRTLCDALAATARPAGRLRVEVDPLRV